MDEKQMKQMMVAVVEMICDELDDLELAVLNNVAQLDQSPFDRVFDYEKVKGLFTQNNGTKMHEETKLALAAVVIRRLGD